MISLTDVYHVFEATVPLYVSMILAYTSIKWLKLFTPSECSGINKFVAKISVPLLSFHVISANDPYHMNHKLLLADLMQKLLAIFLCAVFGLVSSIHSLDCLITGFSLSTLPNTLIIGIPLLKAMYGEEAAKLLGQIVVLQSLIWYTLLLFLFEFRAANATATAAIQSNDANVSPQTKVSEEERPRISSRWIKLLTILVTVGKKLMSNPNTYASLAGLIWSLISFRWRITLPPIVANSISILSDGGLGMAMFSLGLFTALQTTIIACGTWIVVSSMGIRFIIGPILMAVSSYTVGMKGKFLRTAIIQAALPQGLVPFVFAKEYNLHPEIMSTGIIIGLVIAIPVAIAYYFLLDPK